MTRSKHLHTIRELLLDGRAVDRAMREAVKEALLRHERAGVPLAVWRSGEVVRIEPSRVEVSRSGSPRPRGRGTSRSIKGSRAPR